MGKLSEVESEFETPVPLFRPSARINEGFVSLDIVNVQDVFSRRACVMKAPPAFFSGAYRSAMRVALQEIVSGMELDNPTRIERLETLHPPPSAVIDETSERRQGPQEQVVGAGPEVCVGQWMDLLRLSLEVSEAASQLRSRRRRTQQDTVTKRVERAETLVCLGEISAARHALEGSPVAPGTKETLNALRDIDRRPPWPRGPIPEDPSQRRSEQQFLPIWIRMSSSTICEPLVGEQLEALRACATSICATSRQS